MKIVVCIVLRLVFICLISGVLEVTDITPPDWQFWVIFGSAFGLYACGYVLGKESR